MKGIGGYNLWIDLTKGEIEKRPVEEETVREYLLGAGYLSRVLYDSIPVGIDPLSPKNVLGIATGLLTGSMFPQASRHVVAALSPLTDVWGESHAAGFWGAELKFAGYDAIIFTGASSDPVYLHIQNDAVELLDASDLLGTTVFETDDWIREKHSRRARVLSIGQAGENKVRFAAVMNDRDRASARSGLGAVMGSKRLKAISVRGSGKLEVADPVCMLIYLFGDKALPCKYSFRGCLDAADANDDGSIDICDAIRMFRYLFYTGPLPRPPFPECGYDDTEDGLRCFSYRSCE